MNLIQKALLSLTVKSGAFESVKGNSSVDLYGINDGFKIFGELDDNTFIDEGYASNTDLYAIVKKITQTASTIPFDVYKKTPEGLELANDSQLAALLMKPNINQTNKEFREQAMTLSLLTGDRFIYGEKGIFNGGDAFDSVEILPSNVTRIIINNYNNTVVGYEVNISGRTKIYTVEEVWHGKLYNPTVSALTSHRGLSPLQAAYRTLTASNELITAEASFYKNKGASGILSSDSDMLLSEQEARDIQKAISLKLGGATKTNSVVTTGARVKFQAIGMSPSDLDMIKSGDVKLRSLCRAYGVDSKLFGDAKASTYNNVKEVNKQLYTDAVIPNNQLLIDDFMRFVVPAYNELENEVFVIKQDTTGIEYLQGDKKLEAEKNKIVSDTITGILVSPISNSSKLASLKLSAGLTDEEAKELLPIEENTGTGTSENTGENVQVQSLNGAQVTSMVQIVSEVGLGNMPKESAINILIVSYGMTLSEAQGIINPIQINTENEG